MIKMYKYGHISVNYLKLKKQMLWKNVILAANTSSSPKQEIKPAWPRTLFTPFPAVTLYPKQKEVLTWVYHVTAGKPEI